MRRMPIRHRIAPLATGGCPPVASRGIRPRFRGLSPCGGQVAYVLLTRAPVAGGRKQASGPAAPRLACVKPVASVHPEPGSNSPLFSIVLFFFFSVEIKQQKPICCLLLSRRDEPLTAPVRRTVRVAQRTCLPLTPVYFVSSCMGWKLTGESYRRR